MKCNRQWYQGIYGNSSGWNENDKRREESNDLYHIKPMPELNRLYLGYLEWFDCTFSSESNLESNTNGN